MVHGPIVPAAENPRENIATVVRNVSPFALCPACIASKLNVRESEVRRAMQIMVSTLSEFAVTTRVCYGCHMATRLVALRGDFAPGRVSAEVMP
jgi:hypothetical protein